MIRRTVTRVLVPAFAGLLLTGCMPKMTMEDMKQMMPKRPVELDQLNRFVGTWDSTGEMKFTGMDEPIRATGTMESKWDGDNWILVNKGTFTMGELGSMTGIEMWTYDTRKKVFRNNWIDSMGSIGMGETRHDARTDVWHIKAFSYTPFGKTSAKGTMKFLDDRTMEWSWTEYAMGGLMKTAEMKGTSKKR